MKANQVRLQQVIHGAAVGAVLSGLITIGCGTSAPGEPSYAETLAIYNEEVRSLDRLTGQRDKLQQELDSPPAVMYLDAAAQLLGDTSGLSKELSSTLQDITGQVNPSGGEEAQQRQDELIGSVTDQIEQAKDKQKAKAQQWQIRKKEIAAKIAELDVQIADQQKRVDRAMADKNAADAARQ